MKQTVAAYIAKTLEQAGVKRIWGVTGDSLNGLSDSLNRMGTIDWMPTRHEEVAAFAAGAEAQLTGELAVCAGSCGPGNLHLINGLFDCHRNHVPVLAIAAHIPSSEIGSGYFQETHPQELFRECSHYCELVSTPEQIPQVLAVAMRKAVINRGVSVVVLPGDVALKAAPESASSHWYHAPLPTVTPAEEELRKLAQLIRYSSNIALMCGSGCAGAHQELVEFAAKIKAPHRPRPARQRARGVRQPVRCGHDRADWLLLWLPHHDERRYPDPAGHPVPLSRLLPNRRENYPDRHQPRQHRRTQ